MAYPTGTGWFVLAFDDGQTACSYSDSVRIDVDLPFSIDVTLTPRSATSRESN